MKPDIKHEADIKLMVDTFYGKVRADDLLSNIFNARIQDHWPKHLETMYRFWQTVLLPNVFSYRGAPVVPHLTLPVEQEHFDRWLKLFHSTVDELFVGAVAQEAKMRATNIAGVFLLKITMVNKQKTA